MSLNWDNSDLIIESNCPYHCWEIGCTWQCINKEIPYKDIQILDEPKCSLCHRVWCYWDCQKIEILSKLDEGPFLNPLWGKWLILDLLEKPDFLPYIEQEKSKLLKLLSEIDIDTITWSDLILLWYKISWIWSTIMCYEDLSKGLELFKELKPYNKIEKIIEIYPVEKDLQLPSLHQVNKDLERQKELVLSIFDALIKFIQKSKWADIKNAWDKLVKLWDEISRLEIMKKTLEITTWKYEKIRV